MRKKWENNCDVQPVFAVLTWIVTSLGWTSSLFTFYVCVCVCQSWSCGSSEARSVRVCWFWQCGTARSRWAAGGRRWTLCWSLPNTWATEPDTLWVILGTHPSDCKYRCLLKLIRLVSVFLRWWQPTSWMMLTSSSSTQWVQLLYILFCRCCFFVYFPALTAVYFPAGSWFSLELLQQSVLLAAPRETRPESPGSGLLSGPATGLPQYPGLLSVHQRMSDFILRFHLT